MNISELEDVISEDRRDRELDRIYELTFDFSKCPALLIGKAANEFKRAYKGDIVRIYTFDEVKIMLDEYEGISSVESGVLVLDGIGYLSSAGQDALLKFLEESKVPIILLSFTDKVSPIIMSRMKTVIKIWFQVKSLTFMNVPTAREALAEKKRDGKMRFLEEVQFMADNCPSLYALSQQSGDLYDRYNDRILDLICAK